MSTYDRYKTKRLTLTIGKTNIVKMNAIANQKGYKHTSDLYRDIINTYIQNYEVENDPIVLQSDTE